MKKQKEIIEYIRKNPTATQWEINKNCKTHVQTIFDGGIREAYRLAGVEYPENRRKIYGAAIKEIKKRSSNFEKEIFEILEELGTVKKHVKTKHGFVDAILTTDNRAFAIEIKDYQSKPISNSDIKQLCKYLMDLNYKNGLIICNKKNKRKNKFHINQYKIIIMSKDELLKGVVR